MGIRSRIAHRVTIALVLVTTAAALVTCTIEGGLEPEVEAVAASTAENAVEPLTGPLVVAIQPGHWKIDELPAELLRRERSAGASYGDVTELDINIAVVDALAEMLEAEDWVVLIIPATVPPGLRADAFISIHADWAGDPERRGWKLAPPWRPSQAATELAEALKQSFREEEEMREDVGGITIGMRGYFGFSSHRYMHASSPYTPAVLVELGFVTNKTDREKMVDTPEYYARIIYRGLSRHFAAWDRSSVESLMPQKFELLVAGEYGAQIRSSPSASAGVIAEIQPGQIIRPVDKSDGWYEIFVRSARRIGWISSHEIRSIVRL